MKKVLLSIGAATVLATGCSMKDAVKIDVEDIYISKHEITIGEGEVFKLNAVIAPDNATDKSVTWSSGNEDIAFVSGNGIVTGVAYGKTSISVTSRDNYCSDLCQVTVKKGAPEFSNLKAVLTHETHYGYNDGIVTISGEITNDTKYKLNMVGFCLDGIKRYALDKVTLTPSLRLVNLAPAKYTFYIYAILENGEEYTSEEFPFEIEASDEE